MGSEQESSAAKPASSGRPGRTADGALPAPDFAGALESALELHHSLLEAVPGGVVHVSVSGRLISANSEALRIMGVDFDELLERRVEDWEGTTFSENGDPVLPDDYPVSHAIATGEAQPYRTLGLKRADGSMVWGMFKAVPVKDPRTREVKGAYVTIIDITERVASEEALRASEASLRSLTESIPDFVLRLDREGIIRAINHVIPDLQDTQIIGRTVYEFMPPDSVRVVAEGLERVFATGERMSFEVQGLGPGGKLAWYEDYLGPIEDDEGVRAALLIARDVTERRAMRQQLARSERMASVGLLAAGVAHEINNPLAYIAANLNFLAERLEDAAIDVREALVEAQAGAERVTEIVGALKTFSRVSHDRIEPTDVISVLESAINIASTEIRHRAELVRELGDVPPVMASSSQLGQVFLNLLVNAAQALDGRKRGEKGRIVVGARVDEGGANVVVSVEDNGVGIPEEALGQIFDPFYTSKPTGVGTGLGLSICHNIVASLQGRIEVSSSQGAGARFEVFLPVAQAGASVAAPAEIAAGDRPPLDRQSVLIVDDDILVGKAMRRLLERDHDVTVVESAVDAMELLQRRSYDVIFCDVMMPEIDGLDLHGRISMERPELSRRFVFITGGPFSREVQADLDALPNRCIYKPFTLEVILDAVRHVIQ